MKRTKRDETAQASLLKDNSQARQISLQLHKKETRISLTDFCGCTLELTRLARYADLSMQVALKGLQGRHLMCILHIQTLRTELSILRLKMTPMMARPIYLWVFAWMQIPLTQQMLTSISGLLWLLIQYVLISSINQALRRDASIIGRQGKHSRIQKSKRVSATVATP